ncbi:igE-binding protein-like [Meriones unguiculatus]|uniref:igE-binding protein-like n=1 Tax=Meriones unguiculatus TaxID=10047 RepID=UPI00293F32CA|nr:igE-binding protein-like [Meriones unguiculatus]
MRKNDTIRMSGRYYYIKSKVRHKNFQTFPVFEDVEGGHVHVPVDYPLVKELAESVNKYRMDANFTIMQLERLGSTAMTPNDWQTVVKAAFPNMGVYLEWKALCYDACQTQARANVNAEDNQRHWTFELLTGQGPHVQTDYDWGAYIQISAAAIKAWKALSKKGETKGHLTKIIQGPQESFPEFVARMTDAASRIFGDPERVQPMIEQLVYENASPECKAVITPRRNKGLTDWIKGPKSQGPRKNGTQTDNRRAYPAVEKQEEQQAWTTVPPPNSY